MDKKIKIIKFIKKYRNNIGFVFVGIFLVILLLILFINSIDFFVSSIDSALIINNSNNNVVRFDIEGLNKLGIVDK